jgi:hypothetical protein
MKQMLIRSVLLLPSLHFIDQAYRKVSRVSALLKQHVKELKRKGLSQGGRSVGYPHVA